MINRPDFSIIIVSWNTRELTLHAIQSVYDQHESNVEIIVVDNASSDDTIKAVTARFPDVRIIANSENLGYAHANNQGMRQARGDYFVLLNSDAELKSMGLLHTIKSTFETHPKTGILGGTLRLTSGAIQAVGRQFLTFNRLVKQQLLFNSAPMFKDKAVESDRLIFVDYVDGAFLAIPARVVQDIGFMRADFFMYGEDMEWCARASLFGWDVAVLPSLEILHHHAASSKQNFRRILVQNALNNCRFLADHEMLLRAKQAFIVYLGGMLLRVPLSILRRNGLALDYWNAFRDCLKLQSRLKTELTGRS